MPDQRDRVHSRRCLLVILSGVTVWAVAALLGTYASEATVTGGIGRLALIIPGGLSMTIVGPYESLESLGLAIAIGGMLWYWPGRVALAAISSLLPGRDTPTAGFEFGQFVPMAQPTRDKPVTVSRSIPTSQLEPRGADAAAEWATVLFDGEAQMSPSPVQQALAQGDFFRSSARTRPGQDPDTRDNREAVPVGDDAFRSPVNRRLGSAERRAEEFDFRTGTRIGQIKSDRSTDTPDLADILTELRSNEDRV